MHCPNCGKPMETLPELYFHTGKSWCGCEPCNIVIEYNFCSISGGSSGIEPCFFTYQEYVKVEHVKKSRKEMEEGINKALKGIS